MRNGKDVATGLMFVAIALVFGLGSRQYQMGTALKMGPAYYPLLASMLLAVIGVAIAVQGLFTQGTPFGKVSPRGTVLVLSAPIAFAFVLPSFGLVPAAFVTAAFGAAASRRSSPLAILAIAAGLTAFSYVVFVLVLGVSTPAFESW